MTRSASATASIEVAATVGTCRPTSAARAFEAPGRAGDEGQPAGRAVAGEQPGDGRADAAGGADDGDVRAAHPPEVVEEHPRLVVDDGGGEGVAVGHADVGAAAERDPAAGDGRGQGTESDGAAPEAARLVDGAVHAVATLAGLREQVARPEGHEHDVPDLRPADVDRRHRDRRHGQASQRRGIDALGHVAEGSPDAGHVLAEAGARVDGEGEGAGAAHAAKEAARGPGDTTRGPAGRHTAGIWVRVPTSVGELRRSRRSRLDPGWRLESRVAQGPVTSRPSHAARSAISRSTAARTALVKRTSSWIALTTSVPALRSAWASSFPTSRSWWRIGSA